MSIYMTFSKVTGDVSSKGHEGTIEIDNVNFKTQRSINTQIGRVADREGSRPSISELSFTKHVDKSTPKFFTESCIGQGKNKVHIAFTTTGDELIPYLEFELEDVIVSGYHIQSVKSPQASGDTEINHDKQKPLETITLNFKKIEVKYTPFDKNHNPQSPIPAGYDLETAMMV